MKVPNAVRPLIIMLAIAVAVPAFADHIGSHPTPCNDPNTVGGGVLGLSPGPAGPPASALGWDVGNGQCNGSFTSTVMAFPGGDLELGFRAEQRSIGQVTRIGSNEYEVMLGHDTTAGATNRAWWNFQGSIAYQDVIANLDSLKMTIRTDVGPNMASMPVFDMKAYCAGANARNNAPNPTTTYSDICQFSQNPEFGWFTVAPDTDANPTGAFDYDQEGAWVFTLTAKQGDKTSSVSMCVHTPQAQCNVACCVGGGTPNTPAECVITTEDECRDNGDLPIGSSCDYVDCYPLAVTYDSVHAEATKSGVLLSWTTESEIDNVGFRILRETSHNGEKSIELVSDLIPAAGQNLEGMSYEFLDSSKGSEHAEAYYIEDVDLFGRTNRFGPITIERAQPVDPRTDRKPVSKR